MAYMGRGGAPSFSGRGGIGHKKDEGGSDRGFHREPFFRMYYYVPLDNTYVIFEMIAAAIIFTVVAITFFATYNTSVLDAISEIKNTFIKTYMLVILGVLSITILVNCFSKSKESLMRRIAILLIISVIAFAGFWVKKTSIDSTYTKDKFESKYVELYGSKDTGNKAKIEIGGDGLKTVTAKEYYIQECEKAYKVFTARAYTIFGLNILLIVLLVFQIVKIIKINENIERLSKDDIVVYDEEENIKM